MATDYTVSVLEDAIGILGLLEDQHEGLSLAQLTELSGFVKNKVFRILFTLEKHHFVARDTAGRFHLGLRLFELGQNVQSHNVLIEACQPVLDQLAHETGESIFLGIINGTEALCIDARESPQSIRLFAKVGRRAPLHSGGVPKTLLAHLPDEQRRTILEQFARDAQRDSVDFDLEKLETALSLIRRQGYAVVVDELDRGAVSVAAPIRDHRQRVIAALSIAGPSNRFPEDTVQHYIRLVVDATNEISHTLGYTP